PFSDTDKDSQDEFEHSQDESELSQEGSDEDQDSAEGDTDDELSDEDPEAEGHTQEDLDGEYSQEGSECEERQTETDEDGELDSEQSGEDLELKDHTTTVVDQAIDYIPGALDRATHLSSLLTTTTADSSADERSNPLDEFRTPPVYRCGFFGATGSGKSSLINAILQVDVLPTSSSKACTSVVTEISYNELEDFRADLHFVKRSEWTAELKMLMGDINDDIQSQLERAQKVKEREALKSNQRDQKTNKGETQKSNSPKPFELTKVSDHAKKSWQTLVAVYSDEEKPFTLTDYKRLIYDSGNIDLLLDDEKWPFLSDCLDAVKPIILAKGDELKIALHSWVGDKGRWPLIKKVNVRIHSEILSTGTILVDLPGSGDSNAARAAVAEEYRKSVDHYFIVVPVIRGVDSKMTRVTKCDDVDDREIISNYGLDQNEDCVRLFNDRNDWESQLARANAAIMKKESEADEPLNSSNKRPQDIQIGGKLKRARGQSLCVATDIDAVEEPLFEDLYRERKRCEEGFRATNFAIKAFCSLFRSEARHKTKFNTILRRRVNEAEAADIPVFAVSARDFKTLQNATGALERYARSKIQTLQNIEKNEFDRKQLANKWGSKHLQLKLTKRFKPHKTAMVVKFEDCFMSGIGASCAAAAAVASEKVNPTIETILKENSWQGLRAAFRRSGLYAGLDINYEVAAPFIKEILTSWQSTFDQDVFPETSHLIHAAIKEILDEIPPLCTSTSFQKLIQDRVGLVLEETDSFLNSLNKKINQLIKESKKNISSSLTPCIKQDLTEGYQKALEFTGKGSVVRQQSYFSGFVRERDVTLFVDLRQDVLEALKELLLNLETKIEAEMETLARKVQTEMNTLWDDLKIAPQKLKELRESIKTFHGEVKVHVEALKELESDRMDTD
ncbi:hypothetical protein H0H93_009203, partial [Arthromyces matolae]